MMMLQQTRRHPLLMLQLVLRNLLLTMTLLALRKPQERQLRIAKMAMTRRPVPPKVAVWMLTTKLPMLLPVPPKTRDGK